MTTKKQRLYLIDGSNYVFRAFYAIGPLSNSKGLPTNGIYGFTKMLMKLLRDEKPDHVAVAFDASAKTFREEIYKEYKANRKDPPDELVPQFPYFPRVVEALNIPVVIKPGYEADDVIGTIADEAVKRGIDVVIVTGDKDFMQLVTEHVTLLDTMKKMRIGIKEVRDKFGVDPRQVIDVMGLMGDASDNIPGVSGVGPKTAKKLIREYGSIEKLLEALPKMPRSALKENLTEHREMAVLSKDLVTIRRDVPVKYTFEDFVLTGPDGDKLRDLFEELEFSKLLTDSGLARKSAEVILEVVTDIGAIDKVVSEINKSKRFAIEVSLCTNGFDVKDLNSIAIAASGDKTFFVSFQNDDLYSASFLKPEEVLNKLQPVFEDEKIAVAGHGLKLLCKLLINAGIGFAGDIVDTEIMSYVINPVLSHDLNELALRELKIDIDAEDASAEAVSKRLSAILNLADILRPRLDEGKLKIVYRDIEAPLICVLASMETYGIRVDERHLQELADLYEKRLFELSGDIYLEAGEEFVINSPKQLGKILFEKLNLPVIKKTKTGYSTDSEVLTKLAADYRLPQLVVDYRTIAKLKSTYVDALLQLALLSRGRVHTTFNQAVTATGRLSSSDPNLQNIPAKTEEGRRIREAFIADDGYFLLSVDYSQIELRVLAHITGEESLVEAFKKGHDIHSMTASNIFGVSLDQVTNHQRMVGKTVNFSVLYGQTPFGLSKQLAIELDAAREYIDNYFKQYKKVTEFKEKVIADAQKNGYVETLFGRRRYFQDLVSKNVLLRQLNERMAFNAVFQGTAADIIKKAMIEIYSGLPAVSQRSRMLLQVHDELVFEVPEKELKVVEDYVVEKMEHTSKLDVPLSVSAGSGRAWAEC